MLRCKLRFSARAFAMVCTLDEALDRYVGVVIKTQKP